MWMMTDMRVLGFIALVASLVALAVCKRAPPTAVAQNGDEESRRLSSSPGISW